MELGEPTIRPQAVPSGFRFNIDLDTVIVAIGQSPASLRDTTPTYKPWAASSLMALALQEGVGRGDAVTGAATVILAMGAGKTAAESIDRYIKSKA